MSLFNNNRNGTFSEAELRAVEHSVLGGRRILWAGVLAVLLPLAVLLALQYWWLADLERNSAIARKATLDNYLETITKEVHYFYWKISERALNLPPEIFTDEGIKKAGYYFKKKEIVGAKRLFVVSYKTKHSIYFYDPKTQQMVVPDFSEETVAVWAAASPWAYLRKKGAKIENDHPLGRSARSSKPHHPQPHHGRALEARWARRAHHRPGDLRKRGLAEGHQGLPAEVRGQGEGRAAGRRARRPKASGPCPTGRSANPKKDRVKRAFNFVFTDWSISLQGDFASPEKWARANFALNMTLSAVLAAVLLGGIALTVRTALREMNLSAMKNEFVSNVSHELRTPLSSIRVFGEFMRRGRVVEQSKVREYGSYIETESRRLTQLINNILDFSRIESGRKVYTFEDGGHRGDPRRHPFHLQLSPPRQGVRPLLPRPRRTAARDRGGRQRHRSRGGQPPRQRGQVLGRRPPDRRRPRAATATRR